MNSMFQDSVFFGVLISLAAYGLGVLLKVKTGWSLMNPLLISIILVICTLLITGVDYKTYSAGANSISYLLTPAPSAWRCHCISRWNCSRRIIEP